MKRNWKKKYLILSLFPLLLSSCQNSSKQCYRCSMGYMLTSTFSLPYSLILNHQIQKESYPEITVESYYSNLYVLTNQEAVDDFYSRYHENISSEEIHKNQTLPNGKIYLYAISDVPKGYLAYKRDNTQDNSEGEIQLVTDNLYYYADNPNLYYLSIDIKKNESITDDGVFSFFFILPDTYKEKLNEDRIRIRYQLFQEESTSHLSNE